MEALRRTSVPASGGDLQRKPRGPRQAPLPRFNTIQIGGTATSSTAEGGANLEDEVVRCEEALRLLEDEATSLLELDEESTFPQRLRRLAERLQKLASDALERGCSRDMPGAMDVYDSANRMFDRLATLYKQPAVAALLVDDNNGGGGCTTSESPALVAEARPGAAPPSASSTTGGRGGGRAGGGGGGGGGPGGGAGGAATAAGRTDVDSQEIEECVGEACRGLVTLLCSLTCSCLQGLRATMAQLRESHGTSQASAMPRASGAADAPAELNAPSDSQLERPLLSQQ